MKLRRIIIGIVLAAAGSAWAQTPSGFEYGQFLLESRHWSEAAQEFSQVAVKGGPRLEEALYWKAYALNKADRPVEALAAVAELRKAFPASRWLQDASALEMEIKQGSGQSVKPEDLPDEELKLLALNSVMRSDPERAVSAVQDLLKQSHSQALKREALYVLAQSESPKAQALVERVARGGMNSELKASDAGLQALAVRYLAQQKRPQDELGQILFDIYNQTGDAEVRRAALSGLATVHDTLHLSRIQTPEAKQVLLAPYAGWLKEAYQKDRREEEQTGAAKVVADYQSQKDRTARQGIIEANKGDATVLIAIARVENDPYFKKRIVEHLIDLNTPEAKQYLLEILK